MIKTKQELRAQSKAVAEEKQRSEEIKTTQKNKLSLINASWAKRLEQAEQRERDARANRQGLEKLNKQMIAECRHAQQEMTQAEEAHSQWRFKYSDSLKEKVELLREYGVSGVHSIGDNLTRSQPRPHFLTRSSPTSPRS